MKDIREILNQYNIPWKYGNKEEVEATIKNFSKIIKRGRTDMKMIKMNPQNKQYYSTEFIQGWEQGVKDQYEEMSKDILEQIQSSWTPIAELEPTTTDHVLVTYKWSDDDYEVSEMDYWVTKYEAEHGNKWCENQINHVVAWREKPKPFKEKR